VDARNRELNATNERIAPSANAEPWSATFETELGVHGSAAGHNLLVVSDLHIGSALEPSDAGFIKQIAAFNHAFCRFLAYYGEHRVAERPWRLVIAGDMIDFLRASFSRRKEQFEGPNRASRAAVAALERIVFHNRRVFRELAEFVGAGNELVIIKGNHDAEFHWSEVQARLQSVLVELHAEGEAATSEALDRFRSRISFCRWFYYEHDLVYIEHGNQYDEFCSFEHVLSPVISNADDAELEDPISHQTLRVFNDLIAGTMDVHMAETWKMIDYARWLTGLGPRVIARMAYTYFASLSWMVRTRRRLASAALKTREEHHRRLRELTQRFRITEDLVRALDNLRRRPAGNRVLNGMGMLYMDQLMLAGLTGAVLVGLAAAPGAGLVRLLIGAGALLVSGALAAVRARMRQVESHPKLLDRARRLGALLKVPFIVMGHTHVPVVAALTDPDAQEKKLYINTGSWTHEGHSGLTHLCILVGAEPAAELRRWDPATERPQRADV
jgi:UDP-2,3-diacylglucosamine pyrophosphatase LpxH